MAEAVVVRNGEVIASGHNHALLHNDSTCHGEIDAIRKAEQKLGTYDLSGCEVYTTGEPCPMCLAAILWANIEKVYYGCRTARTRRRLDFGMESLERCSEAMALGSQRDSSRNTIGKRVLRCLRSIRGWQRLSTDRIVDVVGTSRNGFSSYKYNGVILSKLRMRMDKNICRVCRNKHLLNTSCVFNQKYLTRIFLCGNMEV